MNKLEKAVKDAADELVKKLAMAELLRRGTVTSNNDPTTSRLKPMTTEKVVQ